VAKSYPQPPQMTIDPAHKYTATIETTAGTMSAELFPKEAPNTVNNFVFLARDGFYENVIFHRVIKGFMIQGGDPTGTGSGGPGYKFRDEPVNRKYSRGILAMANAGPNTNGSQFFLVYADTSLPPSYTVFGKFDAAGRRVVADIAKAGTADGGADGAPKKDVVIKSVG
jgi:cyclophilin family peptidyl-prolyl cis-trans isomerase